MDPKDIYELLALIQKGIFWSFFTVLPIAILIVAGIGGRWLMGSFLRTFDNRYHLSDITPKDVNVFLQGKKYEDEIAYAKANILNTLAHSYLKSYWSIGGRRKNELLIEKYRLSADPYFIACYSLLNDKNQLNYKKDLRKFLLHDFFIKSAKIITVIILIAFFSYKYILPALMNYYERLNWGF